MNYLSVCSGIEAATLAWGPLGWKALAFAQHDPDHKYKRGPDFASAVLAYRYLDIPNLGDMTKWKDWNIEKATDVLVGGTPCQSFSVAGLRKGLDDPRGNLALTFLAIIERFRPRWVVWENVPGVRSSYTPGKPEARESGDGFERWEQDEDRDLAPFIAGFQKLGYGVCWRSLDAQYYNLAQRRQRVFAVGYLGDWRPAAAVLFECESLSWHPAPRRETGERAAPTIGARTKGGGGLGTDTELDGGLVAYGGNRTKGAQEIATAVNAHGGAQGRQDFESETFVVGSLCVGGNASGFAGYDAERGHFIPVAFNGRQDPVPGGKAGAIDRFQNSQCVAYSFAGKNSEAMKSGNRKSGCRETIIAPAIDTTDQNPAKDNGGLVVAFQANLSNQGVKTDRPTLTAGCPTEVAYDPNQVTSKTNRSNPDKNSPCRTLPGQANAPLLANTMMVRRLTPRECERLQGIPDDYTLIPWRGRPAEQCPDGPRYKAIGNSMPVPVMRWIGGRIQMVDEIVKTQAA